MKKWIDWILGILLILACLLFVADMLLYPGKYDQDISVFTYSMLLLSIIIIAVGVVWLRVSFKRRNAGVDADSTHVTLFAKVAGWVYWATCALIIVMNILFIIRILDLAHDLQNMKGPTLVSVTAIAVAILCFFCQSPFNGKKTAAIFRSILFGTICMLTAYICFFNWTYLPKYTESDAYYIIKKEARFASVMPSTMNCEIEGNPYVQYGYLFFWSLYGKDLEMEYVGPYSRPKKDAGWIFFNPITGKYDYACPVGSEIKTDCFVSSASLHFTSDKTAQYYLWLNTKSGNSLVVEYNSRVKSYTLPEDDVLNFLHEMGNKELAEQLEEIVPVVLKRYNEVKAEWMTPASELVITVKLYDIDIATYQNGELLLK